MLERLSRSPRGRVPGLFLFFSLLLALAQPRPARATEPPLLHVIDVGQGSALLALAGDAAVMIDSGPAAAAEAIVAALDRHGIRRVDLWIHTHLDADHLGGVTRVADGVDGVRGSADDLEIAALWDRGIDDPPATIAVAAYLDRFGGARRAPAFGERWSLGGITLEVVGVGPGPAENARGLAIRLTVSPITVLVLGDLPAAEGTLAAARAGPVDVLVASHHGSRDGFTPELLALAGASTVVISAGMDNPHCHPAPELLAWLADERVLLTGAAGLGPDGRCPGLAESMGPEHLLVAGDLLLVGDPAAASHAQLHHVTGGR